MRTQIGWPERELCHPSMAQNQSAESPGGGCGRCEEMGLEEASQIVATTPRADVL